MFCLRVVLDEVGDLGDKLEQVNLEDSEPEACYIHIDVIHGNKEKRDPSNACIVTKRKHLAKML